MDINQSEQLANVQQPPALPPATSDLESTPLNATSLADLKAMALAPSQSQTQLPTFTSAIRNDVLVAALQFMTDPKNMHVGFEQKLSYLFSKGVTASELDALRIRLAPFMLGVSGHHLPPASATTVAHAAGKIVGLLLAATAGSVFCVLSTSVRTSVELLVGPLLSLITGTTAIPSRFQKDARLSSANQAGCSAVATTTGFGDKSPTTTLSGIPKPTNESGAVETCVPELQPGLDQAAPAAAPAVTTSEALKKLAEQVKALVVIQSRCEDVLTKLKSEVSDLKRAVSSGAISRRAAESSSGGFNVSQSVAIEHGPDLNLEKTNPCYDFMLTDDDENDDNDNDNDNDNEGNDGVNGNGNLDIIYGSDDGSKLESDTVEFDVAASVFRNVDMGPVWEAQLQKTAALQHEARKDDLEVPEQDSSSSSSSNSDEDGSDRESEGRAITPRERSVQRVSDGIAVAGANCLGGNRVTPEAVIKHMDSAKNVSEACSARMEDVSDGLGYD